MAWNRPDAALVARFTAALPHDPRVERRHMFGCPCAFVQGNMFAGVYAANLFVRLPEPRRTEALGAPGARPFEPTPGRVMREYVLAPPSVTGRATQLATWLAESFAYAASLPAKSPRRGAAAKAAHRRPRRR